MELLRYKKQLEVGCRLYDPKLPDSCPDIIYSITREEVYFGFNDKVWCWPISHLMRVARKDKWQIDLNKETKI
jgi:hypothetical protein